MPGPEPTTGTSYDTYYVPRSKTPAKQGIYDLLLNLRWRFDSTNVEWWTPENHRLQGRGRLEYDPDLTWARIRPPNDLDTGTIPPPLLQLERIPGTLNWKVTF